MIDILLEVFNKRGEIDERCRGMIRHYCELYLEVFRTHFYTEDDIQNMADFYIDTDFKGNTALCSPGINGCFILMKDLTHPHLEELLKEKYEQEQIRKDKENRKHLEYKRALYAKLRTELSEEDRTYRYD